MSRHFDIKALGPATRSSPLELERFMGDEVRVLRDRHLAELEDERGPATYEQAGPRERMARSGQS